MKLFLPQIPPQKSCKHNFWRRQQMASSTNLNKCLSIRKIILNNFIGWLRKDRNTQTPSLSLSDKSFLTQLLRSNENFITFSYWKFHSRVGNTVELIFSRHGAILLQLLSSSPLCLCHRFYKLWKHEWLCLFSPIRICLNIFLDDCSFLLDIKSALICCVIKFQYEKAWCGWECYQNLIFHLTLTFRNMESTLQGQMRWGDSVAIENVSNRDW